MSGGASATSINPADGELIEQYPLHSPAAIDSALDRAARTQRLWRETSMERRRAVLLAIAAELTVSRELLAETITAEMGKTLREARLEVDKCVLGCEYYAEHGAAQLARESVESAGVGERFVQFPPLGVVLAVMPWNYPAWQVFRAAIPALMAGNTVVLKHASNVTGTALLLGEMVGRAEASLLEVLVVPGPSVADLIGDSRVAAVTFTGSGLAGKAVASACARSLKKSVLELGGSDPFIVLADADVETAAETAVAARFVNTGQSCIAAKRFIAVEPIADAFEDAFARRARDLIMGNPRDDDVDLGPMARIDLRDELADLVTSGVSAGGRVILGGALPSGPGAFYPPTLVALDRPGNPLDCNETFGPVAALIRARDDDDAIELANDSEYGLSSSLWTEDLERARRLTSRIQAGGVFVNGMSASDPRMPFGGVKQSGWGRELGEYGIREFVNVQAVTIAPSR